MKINIKNNLLNSVSGLKIAFKDKSFSFEVCIGTFVLPIFYCFAELTNFLFFFISYFFLLSVELLNTALEILCDRITTEYDESIKAVKDLASAAVMFIVVLLIAQAFIAFSL